MAGRTRKYAGAQVSLRADSAAGSTARLPTAVNSLGAGSPPRVTERACERRRRGRTMMTMRKFKIGAHERGLLYSEGEFQVILDPGRHWFFDPLWKITVQKISVRDAAFKHKDLDVIVKSGALK